MSSTTQNEFVSVLSKHIKKRIIAEIKEAKYFGIIFDSTPDISRVDQMSQIIRYVSTSSGKVEVKEVVDRRWNSMFEAVKPVSKNYDHYVDAINALCNPDENLDTKSGAQILLQPFAISSFCDTSTSGIPLLLGYLYFWADILKVVDQTQQYLQYKGLTLEALKLFLHEQREFLVDSAIQRSVAKASLV